MERGEVDEQLLSAWLDGGLDADERRRVQDWLDAHRADAERVRGWTADRDALAAAFAPVLDEPVPDALAATVWRSADRPAPRRWVQAAAVAGLLAAGALAGGAGVWQWQQQRIAALQAGLQSAHAGAAGDWMQRAVLAHGVYVVEPRHAVEVKAEEEHLARWLTRRIDIPVKLFDLHDQGFALVGGRLLPDGTGKSAQLMYEDAARHRVTVYLRRPESGTDAAFRYEQQGAFGMFYWVEDGAGYALVGELPKATLLNLAHAIYRQHPAVAPMAPSAPR